MLLDFVPRVRGHGIPLCLVARSSLISEPGTVSTTRKDFASVVPSAFKLPRKTSSVGTSFRLSPAHALLGHRECQQHRVSRLLRGQIVNRHGNRWRGGQRLSGSAAPACNEENGQKKEKDRRIWRRLLECCVSRHLWNWHLQSSGATEYTGSDPGSSRCPQVACSRKPHPLSPIFFFRSGASNESSSSTFSRIVCRRRAPMFSVCSFTLVANLAMA